MNNNIEHLLCAMKTIYLLWWPIFWNFCLFKKIGLFFLWLYLSIIALSWQQRKYPSLVDGYTHCGIPATKFSAMKRMEPLIQNICAKWEKQDPKAKNGVILCRTFAERQNNRHRHQGKYSWFQELFFCFTVPVPALWPLPPLSQPWV